MKKKARALRDKFIVDIGEVLRNSKHIDTYQKTIMDNEAQLRDSSLLVLRLEEKVKALEDVVAYQKIELLEKHKVETLAIQRNKLSLIDLEDIVLLNIFSFLDTYDVISAAQICKSLYTRVDILFGIESGLAHDIVNGSEGVDDSVLTKSDETSGFSFPLADEMMIQIDTLSKKLSGYELKLILSITDRLKSLSRDIEVARTEKEDISANLQSAETVRDFLVEKLKGAEIALKSAISEIAHLRKQSESDQEVIAYLDLRTNDLESENVEILSRCQNIQGTLESQSGSHSYTERLLLNEVSDYKHRLEIAESTFKLQKKVLVKEVKSLRYQIAEVVHERDHYKMQLQKFKDALNFTFTAGGQKFGM